jgi:hypothetical protein
LWVAVAGCFSSAGMAGNYFYKNKKNKIKYVKYVKNKNKI